MREISITVYSDEDRQTKETEEEITEGEIEHQNGCAVPQVLKLLLVSVSEENGFKNTKSLRGTVATKAPLRVQFLPALGGGGGKGVKPKLLLRLY